MPDLMFTDFDQIISSGKKYQTIVIDPPWLIGNLSLRKFPRKINYRMMTDEKIQQIPITNFAAECCGLFMWVTLSKIPHALKITESWGFTYHIMLTWHKPNMLNFLGFGRNSEHVIFSYRGKFNIDTGCGSYIPTVFRGKNRKHSQKPDEFYEILRQRTPEPRIDIFARRRHFGFDAYGDQVENETQIPITESLTDE